MIGDLHCRFTLRWFLDSWQSTTIDNTSIQWWAHLGDDQNISDIISQQKTRHGYPWWVADDSELDSRSLCHKVSQKTTVFSIRSNMAESFIRLSVTTDHYKRYSLLENGQDVAPSNDLNKKSLVMWKPGRAQTIIHWSTLSSTQLGTLTNSYIMPNVADST